MNGYRKNDGQLELFIKEKVAQDHREDLVINNLIKIENYTKQDGQFDPSLFIIVSGGEKRERDYFNFYAKYSKHFPRIVIEFICENSEGRTGLDVLALVERAKEIKKHKQESKSEDILDSINIVTDVDDFYAQLVEKMHECSVADLNLIISNPCFEIWLYYAYFGEKPSITIPEDRKKISKTLKKYLNDESNGGIDPRKAPWYIQNANLNSKTNYLEDDNKIPTLFSTQMHILGERLYELSKDDLSALIEKEEETRQEKILEQKKIKSKR
ncbi:MAG: RloB domain-containing protein [Labilibaculum sp.]|nr:RloB domain-containing protein [Labilibaculum sp.]